MNGQPDCAPAAQHLPRSTCSTFALREGREPLGGGEAALPAPTSQELLRLTHVAYPHGLSLPTCKVASLRGPTTEACGGHHRPYGEARL